MAAVSAPAGDKVALPDRLGPIPLALYVHMPWCVRKCPYCDFNSHGVRGQPPYAGYVDALLADLDADLADFGTAASGREIVSIFFGGGTPSLFDGAQITRLLEGVRSRLALADDCEITLETNPGTVEHGHFDGYREAGVNRLSFGVQSFDDAMLGRLGRIHSAREAEQAFGQAREAGFDNINLDLMYALPRQDLAGALGDIERAMALAPEHISHYQLTLEPGTAFANRPPAGLPEDDAAWDIQIECQERLAASGYGQYEVSAYARPDRRCGTISTTGPSATTSALVPAPTANSVIRQAGASSGAGKRSCRWPGCRPRANPDASRARRRLPATTCRSNTCSTRCALSTACLRPISADERGCA